MWTLRNLFKKREKNPVKVEAGRLGGIRSGEARRAKRLERDIEKAILNKIPELGLVREIGNHFDIELSNQELISLIPYLESFKNLMNNHEVKPDY